MVGISLTACLLGAKLLVDILSEETQLIDVDQSEYWIWVSR